MYCNRPSFKRSIYHSNLYRGNLQTYMNYLLANYCMPTLVRRKPSSLFRISKNYIEDTCIFLTGLEYELRHSQSKTVILYENDHMLIILVYQEDLLREIISCEENQSFLQSLGYMFPGNGLEDVIQKLKQRYRDFKEKNERKQLEVNQAEIQNSLDNMDRDNKDIADMNFDNKNSRFTEDFEFPHEIGIILGYPLMDVRDFILHNGKNYLICGYWKVYHNADLARKTFEYYQYIREEALHCVYSGMKIQDVITEVSTSKIMC